MSFEILVLAAFAGLCARALFGWNPVAAIGAASFAILVIPGLIDIGIQHDPMVAQGMAAAYTDKLVEAMPSMIVSEVAGFFAQELFAMFKGMMETLST
jgi:hypothetical protein